MSLARKFRTLTRRDELSAEIDAEMRAHVAFETEELIRNGMSPDEAHRQASIAFGGIQQQKENALDARSIRWFENLRHDVRIATRTLLRHPTFAITATLALSLAIAVNTTMFSVLDAMIHPSVDARDPERIYRLLSWGDLHRRLPDGERDRLLGAAGRTFEGVTGTAFFGMNTSVERGAAIYATSALFVRPDFFTFFGVKPIEGTLTPSPDPVTASRSLVISHKLRAQMFRDDEQCIGQAIDVNGNSYTIIGVARRFSGNSNLDTDLWVFPPAGQQLEAGLVRLKRGATLDQASQEFKQLADRLGIAAGDGPNSFNFQFRPTQRQFEPQRFHYALIGAGLAVLLVACTNLANLQLARGLGRASELALRSALGASRRQVVNQLMIETAVLAAAALVLAIILAIGGNAILRASVPPNIGTYVVEPESNWRMVAFAAVAAVASLVIVGLAPAIHVSRVDLNSLLKSRAGTGAHRSNRRMYGVLVVVQIALTLPLVCGAALVSHSASQVARSDYRIREMYGFDPMPLVMVGLYLPPGSPRLGTPMSDLVGELTSRALTVPTVTDAAVSVHHDIPHNAVAVDDPDGGVREISATMKGFTIVTPSYFRTLGRPIERGKDFQDGGHTEPAIIMDANTGWYLWPRSSPIGRLIKLDEAHSDAPWIKVDGIAGWLYSEDIRARFRASDTLRINTIYRLMTVSDTLPSGDRGAYLTMYVRTTGDPQRVAATLRRELTPGFTRSPTVDTYANYLGVPKMITTRRFIAGLFTTFGLLALGLSGLGVYGIVAQSIAERKREVAVRIALGASSKSIVRALIREGNVVVLAGVAVGLYLTKETIGWLGGFISDTALTSALFFGLMCVALFSAMVLAAFIPAIRATRMDPMDVLRAE